MQTKLFTALLLLVTFAISTQVQATKLTTEVENKIAKSSNIKEIDIEEFLSLYDEKDKLVIIDSRTLKDRAGGFVEDSIALPDTETTVESLAKSIPSKSTPVLFYCNGVKCGRSAIAALIASKAGYSEIYWFKGGWEAWLQSGLPVSK